MQKKIPMRQCLGCREMKPKRELIRVVRSPEGGRGAYLCKNSGCLEKAIKGKALERAFSAVIPEEVYEKLLGEMEAEHDG